MPRRFTASILLDRERELDLAAIAATTGVRFPEIGHVDVAAEVGADGLPALEIDGARVTVRIVDGPMAADALTPPLKPVRSWDPAPAVARHVARLEIACGGALPGLEGAEAYAAAVHFVATAACTIVPACAVFWREGWTLTEPHNFAGGADMILDGRMPLGAWISFATVVPKGYEPREATGMVTYGLRPFIGRELELAPRPGTAQDAWRSLSRVARMALDRGLRLQDGQHLADPAGDFAFTVRERSSWLRRELSAFVLVAEDSVVDVETLKPRARSVA